MIEPNEATDAAERTKDNQDQQHPLLDVDGNPFPFTPGAVICGCSECRPRDGSAPKGPKSPIRLMGR